MGTKRFSRVSIAIAVGAVAALLPLGVTPAQAAVALFDFPCSSGGSTTGDFDNNGFADLAIGAPGDGVEQIEVDGSITKTGNKVGSINVVYSSAADNGPDPDSGVAGPKFFSQNTPGVEDKAETDDMFGWSLAAGDFDNNGADDLAVGVPGENNNQGAVHVFYAADLRPNNQSPGLDARFDQVISQDSAGILGNAEAGDLFGYALAADDINRDGVADLVIGAPKEDFGSVVDAGVIHIVYGVGQTNTSNGGLRPTGNQAFEQGPGVVHSPEVGRAERGDFFGASLAVGQLDTRNGLDVAAGAPGEDVGSVPDGGAVRVLFAAGGGMKPTTTGARFFHQGMTNMAGAPESGDRFGCSLAAGNFDGDFGDNGLRDDDLAVGTPGESIGDDDNAGAVHILKNAAASNGLSVGGNEVFDEDAGGIPGVAKPDDRMGASLAAADLVGDGADDLAVGLPTEMLFGNKGAGSVRVLTGHVGSGLQELNPYAFAQSPSDPASNCWLYGIFDQCGVGPPDYSPLYMVEEENDLFGASIAADDFDRDGKADLAIGAPGEDLGQLVNWVLEEEATIPDELLTNFGIPVPLSIDEVRNAGIVQIVTSPLPTVTNTPAEQDVLYRDSGGSLDSLRDVLHTIPLFEANEIVIEPADDNATSVLTDDAFGHDQS